MWPRRGWKQARWPLKGAPRSKGGLEANFNLCETRKVPASRRGGTMESFDRRLEPVSGLVARCARANIRSGASPKTRLMAYKFAELRRTRQGWCTRGHVSRRDLDAACRLFGRPARKEADNFLLEGRKRFECGGRAKSGEVWSLYIRTQLYHLSPLPKYTDQVKQLTG